MSDAIASTASLSQGTSFLLMALSAYPIRHCLNKRVDLSHINADRPRNAQAHQALPKPTTATFASISTQVTSFRRCVALFFYTNAKIVCVVCFFARVLVVVVGARASPKSVDFGCGGGTQRYV